MAMAAQKVQPDLQVLVGGDPEFFLNKHGILTSSKGLLGGSKHDPYKLQYGAVQEDNIMLEMNLIPSATLEEFQTNINNLLTEVRTKLSPCGADLMINSPEVCMTQDMLHSNEAQEFGCEPDYNAWTGRRNATPKLEKDEWRYAGGHIHVSVNTILDKHQQRNIVKWYDISVGLYCVLHDTGLRRASVYGTAGRFRPTTYGDDASGIEYRVPSNFWVGTKHADSIFLLSQWAMKKGLKNDFHDETVGIEGIELMVKQAINDRDKDLAHFLYRRIVDIHQIGV